MTNNSAARGEGLAGLVARWSKKVDCFMCRNHPSALLCSEHRAKLQCADELEAEIAALEAAAPAGTAQLANERRRDVVEPVAQWLHHQISAACNDEWKEGDNCSDCEQSVMSELFPLLDRALATPPSQVGEGAPERLMTATGPVSLADFSRNLADDIYAISDGAAPDRETLRAMIRARLEVGLKYWKWERAVLGRPSSVPVGEQKQKEGV